MRTCLSTMFICLPVFLLAQQTNFDWAVTWHSNWTYEVAADELGYSYYVGEFGGTVDFDPGAGVYELTGNGSGDAYVLKLGPNGEFIWAVSFGGIQQDRAYKCTLDDDGNVYVAGFFGSTVDFDAGPNIYQLTATGVSISPKDVFLVKYNPSGNFVWVKSLEGTDNGNTVDGLAVDQSGSLYVSGGYQGTLDLDPGPSVHSVTTPGFDNTDMYLIKLTALGEFDWAHSLGGSGNDLGSVSVDQSNNLIIGGQYSDGIDFDIGSGTVMPDPIQTGQSFLLKLSSDANFQWVETFGNWGVGLSDFACSNDNSILVSGYFWDTAHFELGSTVLNPIASGDADFYTFKVDSNGEFVWFNSWQNSSPGVSKLATAPNGEVIINQSFRDSVDFDPGPGISLGYNNYPYASAMDLIILNSQGALSWAGPMLADSLGINQQAPMDVTYDNQGGFIGTGMFFGPVDFDFSSNTFIMEDTTAIGAWTAFAYKYSLGNPNNVSDLNGSQFSVYPNPTSGYLNVIGNGVMTIYDISGKPLITRLLSGQENIDVSLLSVGTYLVEVRTGNSRRIRKFIKR